VADKTRARPVKITRRSESLQTHVRQTVAFRAECECGWRGPFRARMGAARLDRATHAEQH
jgi:hypothetical protein